MLPPGGSRRPPGLLAQETDLSWGPLSLRPPWAPSPCLFPELTRSSGAGPGPGAESWGPSPGAVSTLLFLG